MVCNFGSKSKNTEGGKRNINNNIRTLININNQETSCRTLHIEPYKGGIIK